MSPDLSSFPPPPVVSPPPSSSVSPPFYLNSSESVDQHHLQKNLRDLIENARESWTYAVLWQSTVVDDDTSQSRWGDGYYRGETKTTPCVTSSQEQEYRKNVLQELNSVISGSQNHEPIIDEVVTDMEWFFLISMTHSFVNGNGLAGEAMSSDQPVWICGQEELMACSCDRARQGESFGLKTMVCIPTANGVVELGSTETIFRNTDLINEVGVLFNSPLDLMPMN